MVHKELRNGVTENRHAFSQWPINNECGLSLSLSLSLSHWAGELQRGIPDKTGLPQEELEDSMVYSRQK